MQFDMFDFEWCFIVASISKPVQGNSLLVATKGTGLFNKNLFPKLKPLPICSSSRWSHLQHTAFKHASDCQFVSTCQFWWLDVTVVTLSLSLYLKSNNYRPKIRQATKCDDGSPCFY